MPPISSEYLKFAAENGYVIVVEKPSEKLEKEYVHIAALDGRSVQMYADGYIICPVDIVRPMLDDFIRGHFVRLIRDTPDRLIYEVTETGRRQVGLL
jgi:hypothetical protein